jgi:cytochrome b561
MNETWGRGVRRFHWLMAALLILQWVSGNWDDLLGERFHFSLGVVVLLLGVLRLAWRLMQRAPPALPGPRHEHLLAATVHASFYAVMLLLPLTGIVWRQARERVVDVFGLFQLPQFIAPDRGLARSMHDVHEWLAWAFLVLFGLHLLGVLKHQFIDRDGTLRRMLG